MFDDGNTSTCACKRRKLADQFLEMFPQSSKVRAFAGVSIKLGHRSPLQTLYYRFNFEFLRVKLLREIGISMPANLRILNAI